MMNTHEVLEELQYCSETLVSSPVGKLIICRYYNGRLAELRKLFKSISLKHFPMISDLLQDSYNIEDIY